MTQMLQVEQEYRPGTGACLLPFPGGSGLPVEGQHDLPGESGACRAAGRVRSLALLLSCWGLHLQER